MCVSEVSDLETRTLSLRINEFLESNLFNSHILSVSQWIDMIKENSREHTNEHKQKRTMKDGAMVVYALWLIDCRIKE